MIEVISSTWGWMVLSLALVMFGAFFALYAGIESQINGKTDPVAGLGAFIIAIVMLVLAVLIAMFAGRIGA